jgi:hypothetical protein
MSVYVGIDVHRKRSQVAVVTGDGTVQLNRNVINGAGPVLKLIGGLPCGTPVAFEAAFGWGWLVQLLEAAPAGLVLRDRAHDREHLVRPRAGLRQRRGALPGRPQRVGDQRQVGVPVTMDPSAPLRRPVS